MSRARRTLASATLLFDAGDLIGACNRAYYAMYDSARAALVACGAPDAPQLIKTHSGLITAFTLHLIKSGRITAQYGKSIRQVDQIHLLADYTDGEIEIDAAMSALRQAAEFVTAIDNYVSNLP
jgi:uncharacterized protein (UPF0332 family)